MKVLNEYGNSHHYMESYSEVDFYCPECGKREVWMNDGSGDYYVGEDYICMACESIFYLPSIRKADAHEKKKIEQIKTGVTFEPTTPRGN